MASPANPQSWNQYAYVLNNPTTWTDPNGLDPGDGQYVRQSGEDCLNDPYSEDPKIFDACGGFAGFAGGGGAWNVLQIDPFSLIGIPVVTDASFISPELISQIHWSSIANQNGYATSAAIYTPVAWDSTFVGNAFTLLGGPVGEGGVPDLATNSGTTPSNTTPVIGYSGTIILPIFGGLGPAVTVSYVPGQNLRCIAPGIGASIGRTFSAGPIVGNSGSIKSTLEGASVSVGYQFTPWAGAGGSGNSSGVVSGNTVGVPGASATLTYGFCF